MLVKGLCIAGLPLAYAQAELRQSIDGRLLSGWVVVRFDPRSKVLGS
jgi:hypothetical protein